MGVLLLLSSESVFKGTFANNDSQITLSQAGPPPARPQPLKAMASSPDNLDAPSLPKPTTGERSLGLITVLLGLKRPSCSLSLYL